MQPGQRRLARPNLRYLSGSAKFGQRVWIVSAFQIKALLLCARHRTLGRFGGEGVVRADFSGA